MRLISDFLSDLWVLCGYLLNDLLEFGQRLFELYIQNASPCIQHPIVCRRYGVKLDPQYPRLPYGADAKRSLIAKAVLTRKAVERVSFLPVLIDPRLRPEVLRSGDARFEDALAYMRWASDGFACTMQAEGDEILVQ